jgi:tetratricopeptide (TPR) repeat protein
MLGDALRWNPRALEKDRILAVLGRLEMERGNDAAAMFWFNRFEKETLGTPVFGSTMLAKARLHEKLGQRGEMRRVLEALLSNEAVKGEQKAEALYMIGESHMAEQNPKLAIPYFQRIYVMHQRWRPWVAKAYRRSGEAFESMQDQLSARRTYQELATHPDLEEFPEATDAKARLEALGGAVPVLEPPKADEPATEEGKG